MNISEVVSLQTSLPPYSMHQIETSLSMFLKLVQPCSVNHAYRLNVYICVTENKARNGIIVPPALWICCEQSWLRRRNVLWLEFKMFLEGSCVWTVGPQLVAVWEGLGGVASCVMWSWEWARGFKSLLPSLVALSAFLCVGQMWATVVANSAVFACLLPCSLPSQSWAPTCLKL